MKPSAWIAFAGVVAVVLGYLGTVEYRLGTYQATLDVSERVSNLENLLTPLLIEYRVEQRLAELTEDEPPPAPVGTGFSGAFPMSMPQPPPFPEVREEAEQWATEAIKAPQRQGP